MEGHGVDHARVVVIAPDGLLGAQVPDLWHHIDRKYIYTCVTLCGTALVFEVEQSSGPGQAEGAESIAGRNSPEHLFDVGGNFSG